MIDPFRGLSLSDAYVLAWLEGLNRRSQRPAAPLSVPPPLDDTDRAPIVRLRPDESAP